MGTTQTVAREFVARRGLRGGHLQTVANFFLRRRIALPPGERRLIEVEPGVQVLCHCHWQPDRKNALTVIIVHGLEGSSESPYMLGIAAKGTAAGMNVVRMNQRNCGGTEDLTPALYNSGLSCDVRAVVHSLIEMDNLPEIFVAGFSMGGNLVLKMAGEMGGAAPPQLSAVVGVCPSCDLSACADAIGMPRNRLYERHFVRRLKRRMRWKSELFPGLYPLNGLEKVRSVRQFDNEITAKFCGFRDADDYYARSSALQFLPEIRVPTLLLTAQDDPMIPSQSFQNGTWRANPLIELESPAHGGHCAFISRWRGAERFWAEARIVEFCRQHSRLAPL